jgi:hypothetical protein
MITSAVPEVSHNPPSLSLLSTTRARPLRSPSTPRPRSWRTAEHPRRTRKCMTFSAASTIPIPDWDCGFALHRVEGPRIWHRREALSPYGPTQDRLPHHLTVGPHRALCPGGEFCWPCSPWPIPFPPPPPPPLPRRCSMSSQVLRDHPTSHTRTSQAYLPFPERPARRSTGRASMGSPSSRAWRFRTCHGSLTTQGPPTPRANAAGSVAFHRLDSVGTPKLYFRGSITRPARTPVNASPRPRGSSTHDSGPSWVASPST